MIHRVIKNPNYICRVEDYRGDRYTWLSYSESKMMLKSKLLEKGFTIIYIKAYDYKKWKAKAQKAKNKVSSLLNKGEDLEFNSDIWGEQKLHLFGSFDGKCAYCESKTLHITSGDVEHYRPKKKVEEEPTHDGYYWLAYEDTNYLPSCENCNRSRGKLNHFPITGQRAFSEKDPTNLELPDLLNPLVDKNIGDHLDFDPGIFLSGFNGTFTGDVTGITDRGRASVRIYNLKRDPLKEERKRVQEEYLLKLSNAFGRLDWKKFTELISQSEEGKCEYSAAVYSAYKLICKNFNINI